MNKRKSQGTFLREDVNTTGIIHSPITFRRDSGKCTNERVRQACDQLAAPSPSLDVLHIAIHTCFIHFITHRLYRMVLSSNTYVCIYGIKCSNVSINFCVLKNGSAFNVQCDVFMSERTALYPLNRSPVLRVKGLYVMYFHARSTAR